MPRRKALQDTHWLGPGPQQPPSHSGWQMRPSASENTFRLTLLSVGFLLQWKLWILDIQKVQEIPKKDSADKQLSVTKVLHNITNITLNIFKCIFKWVGLLSMAKVFNLYKDSVQSECSPQ